jgi:hypothetical protein
LTRGAAARVALAFLLANVCACSSPRTRPSDGAGPASPARGESAATTAPPARALGFALANLTGTALRAVYVSPSDSAGWEENVLGGGELADGATVRIGFSPEEKTVSWDIRVEAVDDHYAEWKGLHLRDVSRITLMLDVVGERAAAWERVVVAEVE